MLDQEFEKAKKTPKPVNLQNSKTDKFEQKSQETKQEGPVQ